MNYCPKRHLLKNSKGVYMRIFYNIIVGIVIITGVVSCGDHNSEDNNLKRKTINVMTYNIHMEWIVILQIEGNYQL